MIKRRNLMESTEMFIAYELWHVDEAVSRAARGMTVVCLDYLVEHELKKKNVPYVSLREIVDSETEETEWWVLAQDVAREWYRLPAMEFFQYRGIRIAEVSEPVMAEEYLTLLFYYVRVFVALKKAYPDAHLSIPALIAEDALTVGYLVSFQWRAVVDAARMAGLQSTVLNKPIVPHALSFPRIAWKQLLVRAYNLFIRFAPRRTFKIYASEYWSHIGPIMEKMDDVELVLMESEELSNIPWRQLFTHRIRTIHPADAIRGAERSRAMRISKEFAERWEIAKKDVARYLSAAHSGLDWSPVLEAFGYVMAYSPRVITEIDALRRIMTEEKPDAVLQIASVSDRYHQFLLMARVATELGIPSLELEHASAFIDPRITYSRVETDYLATYGVQTSSWYERAGNAPSRLIPVGSPRFDQYVNGRVETVEKGKQLFTQLGLDAARPVLVVAVPYSAPNLFHVDSYQLAEFFETIREVQKRVTGLQVLFKCRNHRYVNTTREYLRGLFHDDTVVVGSEDIFALLCACDAAVSGNSTVIYQAMLAQKPLLLYPWKAYDTYNAQMYAPALPIARTEEEAVRAVTSMFADASYREELIARQKQFLEGESFDGKSSNRAMALLRRLPMMKSSD